LVRDVERVLLNTRGADIVDARFRAGRLPRTVAALKRLPTLPAVVGVCGRQVKQVPSLAPPPRYPVRALDFSKRDVGLPYGVPRVINAATLKRLAGGQSADRLLKNTRAGWVFVPDADLIDLTDSSQEYRLGRLTIFS
jgi:hypothetical protein